MSEANVKKAALIGIGAVVVVAVVAFASFQGGKSGVEEAAGTIMAAERYRADKASKEDGDAT
ncbi:MAG: hypothetical protein ACO38Y_04950, partial [Steroidobacteraceae bacterium]